MKTSLAIMLAVAALMSGTATVAPEFGHGFGADFGADPVHKRCARPHANIRRHTRRTIVGR